MKALVGLLVALGLWVTTEAFAQEQVGQAHGESAAGETQDNCPCYIVDAIDIVGAFRTKHAVIERELTFSAGEVVRQVELEESMQRLRNTGVFRLVEYELLEPALEGPAEELAAAGAERRILRIIIDERWTLLPAGRIGFGGGVGHLMVGASDANLFGRLYEVGAQFSRTGPANSFIFWFTNPRFLDQRLAMTTDAGLSNRHVLFYEPDGEINGGFLQTATYADLAFEKEWRWWWRTSATLGLRQDAFSYTLISDTHREQQEAGRGLPPQQAALTFGLASRWGRLNLDNYRVHGTQFRLEWLQNINLPEWTAQSGRLNASLLYFVTLPLKSTLGFRVQLGLSRHTEEHQAFFLGGLEAVRGFPNQRFRGAFFWLANAEYRIPSIDMRWLAVQHVVFFDALSMSNQAFDIWGLSAASVGIGLRVMSPKLYGFVGRIGYAFNLYGGDGPGLSMGGGQFF